MSLDLNTVDRHKFASETFFEDLKDPVMSKNAIDAAETFTKSRLRGEGIFRKVFPMEPITRKDLHPMVDSDHPARIEWMEPDAIAGRNIPFDGMPNASRIMAGRYVITFSKIQGPQMGENVLRLMAYPYDIRTVLSDQNSKDLLDIEDQTLFETVDDCLGAPDTPAPMTGDIQWRTMFGGWTNDTIQESFKVLGQCRGKFEPKTAIINHTSRRDFHKWTHNEWGGEIAAKMVTQGFTQESLQEIEFIITIKDHIVPNGTMYQFGPIEAIGRAYVLQDLVMNVKRERDYVYWDCYEIIGAGIGNPTFARVDVA